MHRDVVHKVYVLRDSNYMVSGLEKYKQSCPTGSDDSANNSDSTALEEKYLPDGAAVHALGHEHSNLARFFNNDHSYGSQDIHNTHQRNHPENDQGRPTLYTYPVE